MQIDRKNPRRRGKAVRTGLMVGALLATVVAVVLLAKLSARVGGPEQAAPDFTLETVDGERFWLSAQRGRVVVFEFLVAGCPSCAQQVPVLDRAASRFAAQGVKVLIIDLGGYNDDRVLRYYYRDQYGASDKVLIADDRGFRVARAYNLTMDRLAFVIGRDGRIRERLFLPSEQGLFRAIEAALRP